MVLLCHRRLNANRHRAANISAKWSGTLGMLAAVNVSFAKQASGCAHEVSRVGLKLHFATAGRELGSGVAVSYSGEFPKVVRTTPKY